jgi:ribonuclease HI
MMVNKMKFYAVKVGKTPGVYETWDECSKQVVGFQGAVYKSFPTKEEAIEFVTGKKIEHKDNFKNPTAYVDGSFNVHTKEYSFGAILFVDNKKILFKKKFEADEFSSHRNVAGEVRGASFIIYYALNHGIKELDLYYDYQGIESWYTGEWRANNDLTQKYQNFAKENLGKIKVNFHKVKSHTGIKYNEEVDLLAKSALGI